MLCIIDAIVLLAEWRARAHSLLSHYAQLCCKAWRSKAVSFAPLSTRSKIRDLLESMHYHNPLDAMHSWQQLTLPCCRYFLHLLHSPPCGLPTPESDLAYVTFGKHECLHASSLDYSRKSCKLPRIHSNIYRWVPVERIKRLCYYSSWANIYISTAR
jgi:hypothetical protein